MRFRVLGSLQVWDGQSWSAIAARQQRLLLAVLLLDPGRVVSTNQLAEELWGDRLPRRATATVQVYLGRLRRKLAAYGLHDRLVTYRSGYRLRVDDDDVDVHRFDRLAADAREKQAAGRLELAVERFAEALALWRGPALADVPTSRAVTTQATWWEQARIGVLEDKLGAELELGRHQEIADELGRAVAEHPLRERLHAYHMLALDRCGRRGDALAAYQEARRTLVDELGLEPGPELRAIERSILAGHGSPAEAGVPLGRLLPPPAPAVAIRPTPAQPVVPAQLPPVATGFTGRAAQLKELDELLGGGEEVPAPVVISTIGGAAGVGKTALALHWANLNRGRFPDGQLYVNLRGYASDRPLRPIDALARFLTALGVPGEQLPTGTDEAAALYRSRLANRRILVLLDNANHPDQVRPLLPGGPGCPVLVTSRDQLRGLVARDGAARLDLDVLTPDEARALLVRLLSPERVAADPAATERLARLCGYLPLALRIAAANLTSHPRVTVAEYADRLATGDRLAALRIDGDPQTGVRAALDLSYAGLTVDAQRLLRLLGLVPGPDVTAEAAGALVAIAAPVPGQLLDQLASAHLVDEHARGRYGMHDLVRLYAAGRAATEESPAGQRAAMARLFDSYERHADGAARLLHPHLLRLPPPAGRDPITTFDSHAAAVGWLDAERPNLVAAVTHAARQGMHEPAYRLADALRGYLYTGAHTVDWLDTAEAALSAATASADVRAQAAARVSLATLNWYLDRYQPATEQYEHALSLARQAGWTEGESSALLNLGNVHWGLGELTQAAGYYARSLAADELADAAAASRLFNLGLAQFGLGQLDAAVGSYARALDLHRQLSSPSERGRCLASLGEVYHALGRFGEALEVLAEALTLSRVTGDRNVEALTHRVLATVHRDAGRDTPAADHAATAVRLTQQTGDRRYESDALAVLGSVHHHRGRGGEAADAFRRALALARDIRGPQAEAHALTGLAATCLHNGEVDRAGELAGEALVIARWGGYRLDQARAHLVAGSALRRLHRYAEADSHRDRARELFAAIGAPLAEHARAVLGPLAEPV